MLLQTYKLQRCTFSRSRFNRLFYWLQLFKSVAWAAHTRSPSFPLSPLSSRHACLFTSTVPIRPHGRTELIRPHACLFSNIDCISTPTSYYVLLYHAPFPRYWDFLGNRKWRHSDFTDRGCRKHFLMMDSKRSTPISYLWLMVVFALTRTISEILRFSWKPEMTSW